MSKAGYTEVSLGETLQYEHRIKVNDFVRVLEQKGEIKTSPLKVFPGLELEFVIRKMAETCMVNNIQFLYNNAIKIQANKEISIDKGFRKKLQNAENKNILFDLFNEIDM